MQRGVHITTRSKAGAIALAIAVIALGGIFVVFGLVLLLSLAAVGTVIGAGVMAYHKLTGRWPRFVRTQSAQRQTLDPSQEVFSSPHPSPGHNDRLPPPA